MGRPVVFVIDMLNDCFGHAELERMRAALCSSINRLTALARAKGFPVVWVRQEFEPDLSDAFMDMKRENIRMFVKGTRGPLILDELVRDASDIEVVKKEVLAAGFKLDAESDLLRRPDDKRDWNSSPKAAGERRGTSDRFTLRFVKP